MPEVADENDGLYIYTLTGVPAGLSFDAATRTLSGAPTAEGTTTLTYTATESGSGVTTSRKFTVMVEDGLTLNAVPGQSYTLHVPITPLQLPEAVGLDTDTKVEYSLIVSGGYPLPAGLDFDRANRFLSGTLTVPGGPYLLTYTATMFPSHLEFDQINPNLDAAEYTTVYQEFTLKVTDPNAGFADLNKVILPEIARAMADQRVGAITQRMDQARSGEGARSFNIAGQSTLAGVASAHGQAFADGSLSFKDVLGNSNFVLPLADDGAGTGNGILSSMTLWGGGSYRNLKGSGSVDFDGDLFSTHLGLDTRPRDDLLTGLAVSWSQGDLDYESKDLHLKGDYKLDLTSVHPYANWEVLPGQLDLWVTAGYGWGDLEINDDVRDQASSDVDAWDVAVGGNVELLEQGPTKFRLKSSALLTEMEVEGSEDIEALKVESTLLRMILEGAYKHALTDGAYVEPSLEAGVRYDGGDGETGFGAEFGAGLRYTDPVAGLTLESKARTLVGRDNYEEWGISGLILLEQGRNGRGLSFSLSPGYGDTGSGTQKVWQGQGGLRDEISRDYGARLDTRIGYGMTAPGGRGLLTPYSEMTLGSSDRSYRLGMRWELDALFDLNLIGERRESNSSTDDHAIMLKGDIQF